MKATSSPPLSAGSTHASTNNASVSDCTKPKPTNAEGKTETDAQPIMGNKSRHARRFFAMKLKGLLSHDEDLLKKLEAIVSDEADLSDPDDPNDITVNEELRGWLGEDMNTRRRRAKRRVLQTQAHTQLVEDRLCDLEAKVRKLLKEPDPAFDDEDQNAFPPHERRITSLTWKDFNARLEVTAKRSSQWKHRPEIDLEPKSIIEVLNEEPRYTWAFALSDKYSPTAPEESQEPVSVVPESSDAIAVTVPYRIRIRSRLLLKVIKQLTHCRTTTGTYKHRMLLFPPFKLLITYNNEFRVGLKKLEDKHRGIEQGKYLVARHAKIWTS
ncbi:hypothetical protein DIS24_g12063 [Lasiodiplodia hormozganensis]|uniref:Uncharacterized protein n=1 Tax=Lasiodiplodia hormozganensis TaxID=869390 RepID=A0AA39TGR2_9PEZI|nr:hypothetical protein DIS24_g12063 [Lasiodiplodia hormozganensis]